MMLMCGLYGYINRGNTKINTSGLVKGLAVSAKSRGTHATGISYNVDGHLCTIKAATPADKFVIELPKNVSAVIGHTRHTTQGTQFKNQNNHPFNGVAGETSFALAHNGVLDNDYELQYSEDLPKTDIETDSYVAVQLIEKYSEGNKTLTLDAITKMSELVSGMFAFSILDSNNQFWLVRNDSPIYMVYFKKLDLYVYGSTETIVKDGLKKAGLTQKFDVIDVPKGVIMNIDTDGELSFYPFTVNERHYNAYNPKYAIANGSKTTSSVSRIDDYDNVYRYHGYGSYWQFEDSIRWDLIEQGLTDAEVDLLFEYYTAYQIDDFVYNEEIPARLYDCLRQNYAEAYSSPKKQQYVSPLHKIMD
jgi:glucosamine 6-phosphate synthetase-like amidotransferase/phosphosugar isomerase protein